VKHFGKFFPSTFVRIVFPLLLILSQLIAVFEKKQIIATSIPLSVCSPLLWFWLIHHTIVSLQLAIPAQHPSD
jgi:hypothetical protein